MKYIQPKHFTLGVQYLYVITNKITGEQYVGMSRNPRRRWSVHKQALYGPLKGAINDHGIENFEMRVLHKARSWTSERNLCKKLKPAYNIRYMKGGDRVNILTQILKSELKSLHRLYPGESNCAILKKIIREKLSEKPSSFK